MRYLLMLVVGISLVSMMRLSVSGCTPPTELAACRDSIATLRAELRCVADAIPRARWGHVMGTLYAAYPDTGSCGIVYRDQLTGVVWVDLR